MRKLILTVSAVALAAGLAACGQEQAVTGAPQSTVDTEVQVAPRAAAVALTAAVATVESAEVGTVVTDGDGRSLYRFDKDTAKPPTTTCTGECATAWPPVMVEDPTAVQASGVDPALLGTVERPEGGKQLTIAGWPAYRYSQDVASGDLKGQGAGGTWFAFQPDGKKAVAKSTAANPAVALAVMKVGKLGSIVTDQAGMTLYRFDKDTAKPSTSTCVGDCAVKWPPVLVGDGAAVTGLDASVLGAVARPDGAEQVTVGGWPVYRFAGDKVPCDTNGQGVGGTWFALDATGAKVR
ncbi:hypothetical protein [Actinokineospora diospyrosa]|uniref:Lipoprotein with conserved Yx(FWY)xxD motif n=1 Tax=Actinokineospora diospyrosa TaxID=103728 RepID=A0ABT1IP92_9PSEU|nr:hypothetical protein [Actinokineospora diospyrosa]MCP2274281.1 putative lipoprotein with conserved Yx(FWY)xxD motif [Actinokineospora diospyrosa]